MITILKKLTSSRAANIARILTFVVALLTAWKNIYPILRQVTFPINKFNFLSAFIEWHPVLLYCTALLSVISLILGYKAIKKYLFGEGDLLWGFFLLVIITTICSILFIASDPSTTLFEFLVYAIIAIGITYFGIIITQFAFLYKR
jgi:hypothetical protein